MSDLPTSLVAGYLGSVAVAALFYDHALTFLDELELVWFNSRASRGSRVGFLLNRYVTEIMMVYICYILSGTSESMTTELPNIRVDLRAMFNHLRRCFTLWELQLHPSGLAKRVTVVLVSRVYTLWENRKTIKWVITGSFVAGMSTALMFFIFTAVELQKFVMYSPEVHMCLFIKKPWATDFSLGALTLFDLFIIFLTIANGLHRPYKKESEVLEALVRDGALMFLALFALRLINLMMAVFGNPTNTFTTMTSRMQLRIERLNLPRKSPREEPAELEQEEHELHELHDKALELPTSYQFTIFIYSLEWKWTEWTLMERKVKRTARRVDIMNAIREENLNLKVEALGALEICDKLLRLAQLLTSLMREASAFVDLKAAQNALAPIERLPVEVLTAIIFALVPSTCGETVAIWPSFQRPRSCFRATYLSPADASAARRPAHLMNSVPTQPNTLPIGWANSGIDLPRSPLGCNLIRPSLSFSPDRDRDAAVHGSRGLREIGDKREWDPGGERPHGDDSPIVRRRRHRNAGAMWPGIRARPACTKHAVQLSMEYAPPKHRFRGPVNTRLDQFRVGSKRQEADYNARR
ncbi:hypothetical protein B0H13DRAFT_1911927 [Mycena leptocephala]|nr:hypothetical protein B0H13DRAFT_1911927 [Mycena leptocephala]